MGEFKQILDTTYREEYGRILSGLIHLCGDFSLAEDALQDAFARAAETWPHRGMPDKPAAWLSTVARNRLVDRIRIESRTAYTDSMESIAGAHDRPIEEILEAHAVPDDRLRLIFTCCHPALNLESQIALTLRTLGGLNTGEIARAFLVPEATLAQRIVRAKNKIRVARIPYEVPAAQHLPARLDAVLHVLYLIFNEGYLSSDGETLLRTDLCEEAIHLARVLHRLMRDEAEVSGLLALLLLHHSRARARHDESGDLVTLEEQDRTLWDRSLIEEGRRILHEALSMRRPGQYQIQAAISALHAEAKSPSETDWVQIAHLYANLERFTPTRIVAMNRAVAVAMAWGCPRGLAMLDHLNRDGAMDGIGIFHAARADLLRRIEKPEQAVLAYRKALALAQNLRERRYLERRIDELSPRLLSTAD